MIKVTRKILLFAALLLSSTCCIYSQTYKVSGAVSAMDSINIVEKLYPIPKPLVVIDGLIIEYNPVCRPGNVIVVKTKPESGIDTILLNGHVSKRKNKVELFHFVSSKPPKFSLLEKKWNLNRITSLKIHANGKEVIDDNNNKHIIFVEVETK